MLLLSPFRASAAALLGRMNVPRSGTTFSTGSRRGMMYARHVDPTAPNFVFCYGSLRPDDDSGMPWTKDAVSGMRGQLATVSNAKLYIDQYASLVFGDKEEFSTGKVVGWVLTAEPSMFEQKLKDFDQIEGYKADGSGLYQREIAAVCLGDPTKSIGGSPIGEEDESVLAYVYTRPDCNKDHLIPSGDWLERNQGF